MPNQPVDEALGRADVAWVGGGSVANLLACWRTHEVGAAMRDAWERGVVLAGVSAGSICWHAGGTTDSYGPELRAVTDGLGLLPWGNGVHYDSEEQRRPLVHRLVGDATLPRTYCTDDRVGILYEGTEPVEVITDIEVDPETGAARVLRYTVVQDAGKAVHPTYVEGQYQGGAAQGIGWALNEEYIYGKDGRLQNAGFLDYRIPVCSDLPMIDTQILEIPNPNHPYGVRGVGETSIVPPLAAIANAVSNAVGVRMTHIPMSPPRILAALEASAGKHDA